MPKPHNNQELFSNYYLEERLPNRDSWQKPEGLEEAYEKISELYEERKGILESTKEAQTEEEWIKPILKVLGFKYITQPSESIFDTTKVPDYAFFLNDEDKTRAYKAAEENKKELFDFALAVGDAKRWGRNLNELRPNKQIDEYLRITDSTWGILTNGRLWRLYHLDSSYRLDTYYEVDLVDLIEAEDPEKFKYFYLFFQPHSFVEGGFLTEVYERSEDFTASVSEDLKENAFDALRELCQGFLSGNPDLGEEDLDDIYENSLVLLYRLIFLLYAESEEEENLLPMDNEAYRKTYSLQALKEKVVEKHNTGSLLSSSHQYWSRLRDLFSFIDKGQEQLGVYEYNGGLFDSDRHPFFKNNSIGDKYIAEALRKVSYSEAENGFIDYQDLDVRELGAIYEGLLEHKPVVEEERVKWEEDLSERKKTGSYYTPEYIVKYIVENTIGPLVEEKKEEIKGEIEELKEKLKGSRGYDREAYERKLEEKRKEVRKEILDLKVLDPAMGSGHFLVEATEKLANSIASLEEEFSPDEEEKPTVQETDKEDTVKELKRQIVERSIYGVDKNPLATELAKLSLWLHTVAKGEPLSFLDHHLRTGDSLIGIDIEEMKTMPSEREQMAGLFTSNLVQDLGNAIGHLNLIEEITSGSRDDVQEKKTEWRDVRNWIDKYKKAANVRLSTSFGNEVSDDEYRAVLQAAANDNIGAIKEERYFKKAENIANNHSFFHWELEFPDVFRNQKGKRKNVAGFDIAIGNPPYVKRSNLSGTGLPNYYNDNYQTASGNFDLYLLFTEFGSNIINKRGEFGYILPSKFTTTKVGKGLRKFIESELNIREFVDFDTYQVFEGATTYTCLMFLNYRNGQIIYKNVNNDSPRNIDSYQTFKTEVKKNMSGIGWDLKPRTINLERFNQKVADIGKIFTGIETGLNEVFVIEKKGDPLYDKFIKYEGEIVHKYLKGELVERYYYEGDRLLVITPYDEEGNLLAETTIEKDFPEIYKYLRQNEEELRLREGGKMDGEKWYGYVYPKNLNQYDTDRLIWMDIAKKPEFCIDKESYWHSRTVASLIPDEKPKLRDLEGILNSKLFLWYMTKVSNKVRGGYLRFKPQYVGEFPLVENYDSTKISELAAIIERKKRKRESYTLNLLDYFGNYSEGTTLGDLYSPFKGLSDSFLIETTEKKDNLRLSGIEFETNKDNLILKVSARYKPTKEGKYETDQWGYIDTNLEPAMRFSVDEKMISLIREFVPVAMEKASGFANFRKNATKTISPIERLEKLTLPKLEDVESGLEKYLEQKEKAEKLEGEIQETDHQIDAVVFDLYDLNEEEVRTVLDSLETPETEKKDILAKFREVSST